MDWQASLKECAALVDQALPGVLRDLEPANLREAAMYYPSLGGKRLRPALAMLACEAAGGKREDALYAAIAVELVHNFSLVHDDIMDKDATRRGQPSVHVKWDEPTAILAGDALFAKAFEALDLAPAPAEQKVAMLHELALATRKLCEGQQRDMELAQSKAATPEDYYGMIHGKTGRLFEAATRMGALSAKASPARVETLSAYGKGLGKGFQVRDDVLGLIAPEEKTGKPWGSDVRNGKRTVILLLAQQRAEGKDAETLRATVGNAKATKAEIEQVIAVFRSTGALDEAQAQARTAADQAIQALQALPAGGARTALEQLARFSVEREH
jgi:geranylgeranyl diphosphate synthase, type I